MIKNFDVVIIGGGLAGLTAAIHLVKKHLNVLLIEKNEFPSHKVCGEYVSNEVLPYLKSLGFDPFKYGAKQITKLNLSGNNGQLIETDLPLGGFSISRYKFDYELLQLALKLGLKTQKDLVTQVQFNHDLFKISTKSKYEYKAKFVIGSFGKRSNLDVKLKRSFIKNKTPYVGVKGHYHGDFPNNIVGLHNFEGGYCGVSKIENNQLNICYITDSKVFKLYKNFKEFEIKVLSRNEHLKSVLSNSSLSFKKPITISQVSFESKKPVEEHILMCGDSAGMIHPLAGNGMSMAIRSSQMISENILEFFSGNIKSRKKLESIYQSNWKKEFNLRLKMSKLIEKVFNSNILSVVLISLVKTFPFLLKKTILLTHGKTMRPSAF